MYNWHRSRFLGVGVQRNGAAEGHTLPQCLLIPHFLRYKNITSMEKVKEHEKGDKK